MAVEAISFHKVYDTVENKVAEKVEKSYHNKVEDFNNEKVGNTYDDKAFEKDINKIKDKLEVENSFHPTTKLQLKKLNLSITSSSSWKAIKKNVRIVALTLLFVCLYFTIKSTIQTTTIILHKINHLNKNIIAFHKSTLTTLMSTFEVNFNKVNKIIKEKYHHLQNWYYEDVKGKEVFINTSLNFLHYHKRKLKDT